jgi:hypothetical protein
MHLLIQASCRPGVATGFLLMFVSMTNKLYRVQLRGMQYNTTGPVRGISFVVAHSSDEAYQKVRKYLDEKDYGFSSERQLQSIELLAEELEYTEAPHLLFL